MNKQPQHPPSSFRDGRWPRVNDFKSAHLSIYKSKQWQTICGTSPEYGIGDVPCQDKFILQYKL